MISILVGYVIDGKSNGIDKYLVHMLELLKENGEEFKIQFLTNHTTQELEKIYGAYKADVIEEPSLKHPIKQCQFLKELIKNQRYDIAYFNISEAFNAMGILAAHRAGVKKIIVHAHSSKVDSAKPMARFFRTALHEVFRPVIGRAATDYCACSEYAGYWMFSERIRKGSHYQIVHNAIHVPDYAYNPYVREQVREELGLHGKLVIGHIGKYCYAKNNFFLLDIMEELLKTKKNAVLLAVGEGEDWESVKEQAQQRGLSDSIMFLGIREDVPRLLQAMDFFVLPSRFEGQPIVAIEAQAAGLYTIVSDTITPEVVITTNCSQLSITMGAAPWVDTILAFSDYLRGTQSQKAIEKTYGETAQKAQLQKLFGLSQKEG